MDENNILASVSKFSPLHAACHNGDVALVRQLISEGYSVNEPNFDLVQPLHEACFGGHVECARILIEAGAVVNGRNIDGSTPLCDACSSGSEDCVRLLLEHGATVNPQLLLSSPLHEAVLRDKWRCAKLLIEAGASLNHTDCHFGTPLHAAVQKGCYESVKTLLKAEGVMLHFAARQQDAVLVSLLLEFGADPWLSNNSHLTAKDMVPSSTSQVRQILQHWESTPRSLRYVCRSVIREKVGANRLRQMDNLKLPKPLLDYIAYAHV